MLPVPELLAPAGDLERLEYALRYGADAVYAGLQEYGMRSAPQNFTMDQLAEGAALCHARGKKLYLTLNTLPMNEDLAPLPGLIREAWAAGADAFIVADLGVLSMVKENAPEAEIHLSTQAGVTNWAAARAAWELGAKRVVLARELDLGQIAEIRANTPPELELEAFVHGAMCMSVSGRCLLSQYLAGRDANQGRCAQPCRWKYYLVEETRPGRYMEIGQTPQGSYILSADDLCTAPFIDLICAAGVDSLKIEGRAKTLYYVASVTSAYRQALDAFLATGPGQEFLCPERVLDELDRTSHRRYSPGFYFGAGRARQDAKTGGYIRHWEFVGVVESWREGIARCTQRGKFTLGDELEALTPAGEVVALAPAWLRNAEGERIEATPHPMMVYDMPSETPLPPHSLLRRRLPEAE